MANKSVFIVKGVKNQYTLYLLLFSS